MWFTMGIIQRQNLVKGLCINIIFSKFRCDLWSFVMEFNQRYLYTEQPCGFCFTVYKDLPLKEILKIDITGFMYLV